MNAPSDERLMRYFDGELDDAESRAVEAWLETSERGRALMLELERVGVAVRAIGDDLGSGGDGIADAVMARIGAAEGTGARAPAGTNVRSFPGGRRLTAAVPAVGLALAAAAAIALYLRPAATPSRSAASSGVPAVTAELGLPASPAASEALAENAASEAGASIESVDFGGGAGSIFMVPSGGQSSEDSETPVVWLMDDVAPDEGRMAPL